MQDTVMSEEVQRDIYSRSNVELMEAHAVSEEMFPDSNVAFLIELYERVGMMSFRILDRDEFYKNLAKGVTDLEV